MEKKFDGNYTRMLQAVLNKSWKQHPKKQLLYSNLPLITKTIQVRRTRHEGQGWRSKDELISDVLPWTPSHGRAKVGRPARTYKQLLYADIWCSQEDLPGAMDDRDWWRERIWEIRTSNVAGWWWYVYVHVCLYVCGKSNDFNFLKRVNSITEIELRTCTFNICIFSIH